MDFKTVAKEILGDVMPLRRVNTRKLYQLYLNVIIAELGDMKLNQFTRADYMKWIVDFKCRNNKRKTFADYTKFINLIFNFAYQQKYISHLIKFPSIDPERDETGRIYTHDEIQSMWRHANESMRAQLVLSLECFMRLREVLHLTWDRVDLEKRVIVLRRQDVKTGTRTLKGRSVPLSTNAVQFLAARRAQATTSWVFPNPNHTGFVDCNKTAWNSLKLKAGIIGKARWHDLRHTALSYAVLEKRIPLIHISRAAGLSIRTLERVYVHHDIEHLRDVAAQMSFF